MQSILDIMLAGELPMHVSLTNSSILRVKFHSTFFTCALVIELYSVVDSQPGPVNDPAYPPNP
jgi:hypothetical protein